jgi:cytochrome-b5 reductase
LAAIGCGGWYWQQTKPSSSRPLSYGYFIPLAISAVERITPDTSILSLELPAHLKPDPAAYPEPADTPLQAVYVRQPELQIQRAYTPLSVDCFSKTDEASTLRLLVKRYNDGEASSYMHRLKKGHELYVRGPVRTWTIPECDRLVFVSFISSDCLQ